MSSLPESFVYLDDIDPSILVHLRYFTEENFLGKIVEGYYCNRAILTKKAAFALSLVQKDVMNGGYRLVVYDSYRPCKAVSHFVTWSDCHEDIAKKSEYYPYIDKNRVFELGYIATHSGHSRGSTVDVSLIPIDSNIIFPPILSFRKLIVTEGVKEIPFLDDGTVDMGSSFDLFDEASHFDKIPSTDAGHMQMRRYLKEAMEKHGFKSYYEEWWHFSLSDEPFPDTYFDFDIK